MPPNLSTLDKQHIDTPALVDRFLQHLLAGDEWNVTGTGAGAGTNDVVKELHFLRFRVRDK